MSERTSITTPQQRDEAWYGSQNQEMTVDEYFSSRPEAMTDEDRARLEERLDLSTVKYEDNRLNADFDYDDLSREDRMDLALGAAKAGDLSTVFEAVSRMNVTDAAHMARHLYENKMPYDVAMTHIKDRLAMLRDEGKLSDEAYVNRKEVIDKFIYGDTKEHATHEEFTAAFEKKMAPFSGMFERIEKLDKDNRYHNEMQELLSSAESLLESAQTELDIYIANGAPAEFVGRARAAMPSIEEVQRLRDFIDGMDVEKNPPIASEEDRAAMFGDIVDNLSAATPEDTAETNTPKRRGLVKKIGKAVLGMFGIGKKRKKSKQTDNSTPAVPDVIDDKDATQQADIDAIAGHIDDLLKSANPDTSGNVPTVDDEDEKKKAALLSQLRSNDPASTQVMPRVAPSLSSEDKQKKAALLNQLRGDDVKAKA